MAVEISLADQARDAANDAISALHVSGSIEIRSGTRPATADTTATGTVLATLTLDATPIGSSSSGVASWNDLPLSVTASATGTAGWFRVYDSTSGAVWDGNCGTSAAAMVLSTLSLVSGVAVSVTIASSTMPESAA